MKSSTEIKKILNLNDFQLEYCLKELKNKFPKCNSEKIIEKYLEAEKFKINENVYDKNIEWNDEIHYFMRLVATEKMKEVFNILKIDLNDDNVKVDLENGNIGTPGRIVKMWSGSDTHDDRELLGGRFHQPIRLAKFPNTSKNNIPIIKEIDLTAVCSHHLAPFSTKFSEKAKVVVAYIPNEFVLGISKLQRVVRYVAQRGWLQEDLTKAIYDEISKVAETEDVYVRLKNIKHSCEFLRGALSDSDGFTTEYYGGKFKDTEIRKQVKN